MKERAEQFIDELREFVGSLQEITTRQDVEEVRIQLKAVARSVQQLEAQNVSVPDDLRRLKINLTSELSVADEAEEALTILMDSLRNIVMDNGKSQPTDKRATRSRRTRSKSPVTEGEVFREIIFDVLRAHGGRAQAVDVLEEIEKRLDGRMLPGDLARRKSGDYSWRNNAHWERLRMVREGFMKSDSPRGWWELAPDETDGKNA